MASLTANPLKSMTSWRPISTRRDDTQTALSFTFKPMAEVWNKPALSIHLALVVLTRLHAHPIVDVSPRKGVPVGSPVAVSRGVPA